MDAPPTSVPKKEILACKHVHIHNYMRVSKISCWRNCVTCMQTCRHRYTRTHMRTYTDMQIHANMVDAGLRKQAHQGHEANMARIQNPACFFTIYAQQSVALAYFFIEHIAWRPLNVALDIDQVHHLRSAHTSAVSDSISLSSCCKYEYAPFVCLELSRCRHGAKVQISSNSLCYCHEPSSNKRHKKRRCEKGRYLEDVVGR
jgi:hypothetical protein